MEKMKAMIKAFQDDDAHTWFKEAADYLGVNIDKNVVVEKFPTKIKGLMDLSKEYFVNCLGELAGEVLFNRLNKLNKAIRANTRAAAAAAAEEEDIDLTNIPLSSRSGGGSALNRESVNTLKRKQKQESDEFKKKEQNIIRGHGVGGTLLTQIQPALDEANEGIDLKMKDTYITRDETVEKLVAEFKRSKSVLVRAPPYSGKTSLAILLEDYMVTNRHNRGSCAYGFETIRFSCLDKGTNEKFAEFFDRLFGQSFDTIAAPKVGYELDHPVLVIIDECQIFYHEVDSILWNKIKSSATNLFLVCFSVYGPQQIGLPKGFPSKLDLSILKFTSNEFDAFFNLFFIQILGIGPNPELHDFVKSVTDRHPGLLKSIFKYMLQYKRYFNNISAQDVFAKVRSDDFLIYMSTTARCCFPITTSDLTDQEIQLCKEILKEKNPTLLTNRVGNDLVKKGVLSVSELDQTLSFSCPLISNLFLNRFLGNIYPTTRAAAIPSDPTELVSSLLKRLDYNNLNNSFGVDKNKLLYEYGWQVELYQHLKAFTPKDVTISVNVGPSLLANGWIDLYINGKMNWGVEVIRESDKLKEHLTRVHSNYMPIVMLSNKIIIIDFVSQESTSQTKIKNRFSTFDSLNFPNKIEYFYISFNQNYTEYSMYYKAGGETDYYHKDVKINE